MRIKKEKEERAERKRTGIRGIKGYFTPEAAILFPMLTVLVVFVLYLGFYLYNACIAEQCAYLAAFRGSCLPAADSGSRALKAGEEWQKLQEQRLLPLGQVNTVVREKLTEVSVEAEGKLKFPFYTFLPGSEADWKYEYKKKAVKLRPVILIREIRRIQKAGKEGGKKDADSLSEREPQQLPDDS